MLMTPGLEGLGGPQRLADVAAPDRAGQAVRRRVGEAQRLFLRVERDDRHHRAEDLLAGDAHVVVDCHRTPSAGDTRHRPGPDPRAPYRRRRSSRPRPARSRCSPSTRSRCFALTSGPDLGRLVGRVADLRRCGSPRRTARRPGRGPSARRGSGSGRSSPGRRCRRRCTAIRGRTSRGPHRRTRCSGSCRRARARSSSRWPRRAA